MGSRCIGEKTAGLGWAHRQRLGKPQKIDPARTGDTPRAWTELRFEGEQGKLAPQGLLGNGIRFVKRAPGGGTMWVGTGLGLSRVEEGTGRVVSLAPLGGLSTLLFARDNEGPLAGTGKTRMLLGGSLVNLLWTEPETEYLWQTPY